MKKYFNIGIITAILSATMLLGCKKNIQDLNVNPNSLSKLDAITLDLIFSSTQYRGLFMGEGVGTYQTFVSLYTDQRAQYFACTSTAFPSDRNEIVGNWLNGSWSQFYSGATQLQFYIEQTADKAPFANPIKNAMAKIWKVFIFIPLTDAYGPVPYFGINNAKSEVPFDSQEALYMDFFKTLKESAAILKLNAGKNVIGKSDLMYQGDMEKWIKLANTLRLRCAMRISDKNPTLAKTEGEAAAQAPGGLLSVMNAGDLNDNAELVVNSQTNNALAGISNWGEFRMSAAMQSVLQGYNDPRMSKFFAPGVTSNKFKGLRNGMSVVQMGLDSNSKDLSSNLADAIGFNNKATAPIPVMYTAEAFFLLAEAKLKGWNVTGTVKENYENGIRASMDYWKVDPKLVDVYIQGTTLPNALHDIYKTPALTDIPVALSDDPTKQLEQIITQKWLALFPISPEAWSDFRRTDFPKLYPRLNSDNVDAGVAAGSMYRLQYPTNSSVVNPTGYKQGVQLLSGPDKVNTKVWWDVK